MKGLSSSVCLATSNPAILATPSVGSSNPQSMRITVDLPEPFGPRKTKMEPFATLKLTELPAVKCPKRFVRPIHSIMAESEVATEGIAKRRPKLQGDHLATL